MKLCYNYIKITAFLLFEIKSKFFDLRFESYVILNTAKTALITCMHYRKFESYVILNRFERAIVQLKHYVKDLKGQGLGERIQKISINKNVTKILQVRISERLT